MSEGKVEGLRMFLITLIDFVSHGKKLTCEQAEEALSSGIASKLYVNFAADFERNGFNPDNIRNIDEYFKNKAGIADGNEFRKYTCKNDEGYPLIIKLALDDIF